jgi:hypothetical protein
MLRDLGKLTLMDRDENMSTSSGGLLGVLISSKPVAGIDVVWVTKLRRTERTFRCPGRSRHCAHARLG